MNRHFLLPDAINSVLLQEFGDFELVISDNHNDERTRQAIEPFLRDPRIRCRRTNEVLSMPEHWEFATGELFGKYVMVLTDRSVLKKGALRAIYDGISEAGGSPPVCSWRWAGYDEMSGVVSGDHGSAVDAKPEVLQAVNIAQEFADNPVNSPYKLPRGLNSCYRADVADEIRAKFGGFFLPLTPDYSSAFMLLAKCDTVLYFDTPLFLSQGGAISNGGKCMEKTAAAYLQTLRVGNYYAHVPIKSPLVKNTIWNDLFTAKAEAGGNLNKIHIDWFIYFVDCYKELLQKLGSPANSEKLIKELFDEWRRALASADSATQHRVLEKVGHLSKLKRRMRWRRSFVGVSANALKQFGYQLLGLKKRKTVPCHASVLEAAGFHGHF